ncbi:hypothetical protein [Microbacterium gilvum]|uniref:Integral membrane protein n=1 Tax=Microbacterium gilvum TaxID=1336204 RepID=A0ABP8ZVS0_9MICO
MYILLALIAAAVVGIAVHFATPRRELRGVALIPAVAAAVAAALYTALTWAGLGEASFWQWAIVLAAAAAAAVGSSLVLTRIRGARDAAAARAAGVR